jgi:hypothetical protein
MRRGLARAATTVMAVLLAAGCASSAATVSPGATSSAATVSPATTAIGATPSPAASPAASPTDATAPSPLPFGYTGLIFNEGDCWDMDTGAMVADASCDFRLDQVLIMTPQNGALISGSGLPAAPSLAACMADPGLLPDRLAPNTDIYLCTRTNQGVYGFVVERHDAPGAPSTRLILDYWLYK